MLDEHIVFGSHEVGEPIDAEAVKGSPQLEFAAETLGYVIAL